MALKGLEADRAKLDDEIAEIERELGQRGSQNAKESTATAATSSLVAKRPKTRTMSPEAKKRISEGMKRRYAELRKILNASKK
jgi:hypothetical protein